MIFQQNYRYIEDIDNALDKVFTHSSLSRSKNLVIRLDFRYPVEFMYPNDNTAFSKLVNSLITNCKRKDLTPYYVWVREQSLNSLGGNHHFHMALFLDGNMIQNPFQIHVLATKLWGKNLGHSGAGLVHMCPHSIEDQAVNTAVKLRRSSPNFATTFAETKKWLRYLSKEYSKIGYPYNGRRFGASQILNPVLSAPTPTAHIMNSQLF